MIAFEVSLNGKLLGRAGVEKGVTNAIISNAENLHRKNEQPGKPQTRFYVGAYDDAHETHLTWADGRLQPGDEIRITVVETPTVSPATKTRPRDTKEEKRRQRKQVEDMAKQFGWKIVKRPGAGK